MTARIPRDEATEATHEHITASYENGGRLLRITLARPKANILDRAMIEDIRSAIDGAMHRPALRAVLFDHQGSHFSFGASVREHLPDQMEDMLGAFHGMFRDLMSLSVPTLAAVRGQALGAGCELATFCHRVFVAPDTHLGQPEIRLAVFAPVASIVLPIRVGQAAADDLLLSGRSVVGQDAVTMGLADELSDDPAAAASTWFAEHLEDKSASSLRHAVRASRFEMHERLRTRLDEMERLYLSDLMSTADATEGLNAFLEKRAASWSDS